MLGESSFAIRWVLAGHLLLFWASMFPSYASAQGHAQYASVLPLEVSLQRIEGQSRRHFSERCSAFFVGFDDREAIDPDLVEIELTVSSGSGQAGSALWAAI